MVAQCGCSVEGCSSPIQARGLCNKHYKQWFKHGGIRNPRRKYAPDQICSVDGCDRGGDLKREMCDMHYLRWRRSGTTDDPVPYVPSPCEFFEECGNMADAAHGWCKTHYARWQRTGDPTLVREHIKGPDAWNWVHDKSAITYDTAHAHTRAIRGDASCHLCIQCSEPAEEWAYDGNDPDERTEPRPNPNQKWAVYSVDPYHYQPMCVLCHRRMDLRKTNCPHGHLLTEDNVYTDPDGHRTCRDCYPMYQRRYRERHPERGAENTRRYRERHPGRVAESQRRYREKKKEQRG